MNYIIRVRNEAEWREVLQHYDKEFFTPFGEKPFDREISISNNKYDGYNKANSWFEKNYPYSTYKFLSFSEWKQFVSPLWKVGDKFQIREKGEIYTIDRKEEDTFYITWPGEVKGAKYTSEELNTHFKNNTYTLVKEQPNMNNKQYFSAQGSKFLKKALIEQLEAEGFKPCGCGTKGSILDNNYTVGVNKNYLEEGKVYVAISSTTTVDVKYTLPQDYDAVLQAFRDFYKGEETLKEGDYIYFLKNYEGQRVGTIKRISRITEDNYGPKPNKGWIHYQDGGFRWGGNGYYLGNHFRKATEEEIAQLKKTIQIASSVGSFPVEVGVGYIKAEGVIINVEDLIAMVGHYKKLNPWYLTDENDNPLWTVSVSGITVGCKKDVPLSDLAYLITEYSKLNS